MLAVAPAAAADLPPDLAQLPRPVLSFTGATQNESAGTADNGREGRPIAQHCDIDGDGIDDLIFGAHGFDTRSGRIFFQRGRSGLTGGLLTQTADTVIAAGFQDTKAYGTWTECAGDFDGDGIDDVLVGSEGRGSGKEVPIAYVFLGGEQFFTRTAIDVSQADPEVIPIAPAVGTVQDMGTVAAIDDLDGDGRTDLAVSLPLGGKVFLVAGRATSGPIDPTSAAQAREILTGVNTHPTFVTGVGDLDGDGLNELAVTNSQANGYRGRIEVVSGAFLADDSEASFNLPAEAAGERLLFRISGQESSYTGYALAPVPDLNGDGRGELAIGSPWPYGDPENEPPLPASAGQVHVVFGTTSHDPIDVENLGTGGYTVTGPAPTTFFGTDVAASPDLNGDGLAELLVGNPGSQNPAMAAGSYAGRAYVIYGKADSSPISTATLDPGVGSLIHGTHFRNHLGFTVASLGDVDGNGAADLAFSGWAKNFTGHGDVRVVQLGDLPSVQTPEQDPGSGDSPPPAAGSTPVVAKPTVRRLAKEVKANAAGIASLARISCPADGGRCTATVPATVKLTIGGRQLSAKTIAPKRIAAGKKALVRAKLSQAAIEELAGGKASVRLKVVVANDAGRVAETVITRISAPGKSGG